MSKMPDNYAAAEAWAKDRVGKRVYRAELGCQCPACKDVVAKGMLIVDELHASYITDCAMEMGYRYQDEPINASGQVEAGPGVQALLLEGLLERGPNAEPSDVDTDQPSERASDGDTVSEVLD